MTIIDTSNIAYSEGQRLEIELEIVLSKHLMFNLPV